MGSRFAPQGEKTKMAIPFDLLKFFVRPEEPLERVPLAQNAWDMRSWDVPRKGVFTLSEFEANTELCPRYRIALCGHEDRCTVCLEKGHRTEECGLMKGARREQAGGTSASSGGSGLNA